MRTLLPWLLAVSLLGGCVADLTGRSSSYLMQQRIDTNRDRSRTLEKDLTLERSRVDTIEERASAARHNLAESGASLETLFAELQSLRGDVTGLRRSLDSDVRFTQDLDLRISDLELRLYRIEQELELPPPSVEAPTPDATPAAEGLTGDGADPASEGAAEPATPAAGSEHLAAAEPTPAPANAEEALFQSALLLVQQEQWEKAGGKLQRFLRSYPESKWVTEAQFLIAECLFGMGRLKAAINEFQKVVEADGEGEWAPRAMFKQALAFKELGGEEDREAARVFFGELVRLYPDAPEARDAQTELKALGGS